MAKTVIEHWAWYNSCELQFKRLCKLVVKALSLSTRSYEVRTRIPEFNSLPNTILYPEYQNLNFLPKYDVKHAFWRCGGKEGKQLHIVYRLFLPIGWSSLKYLKLKEVCCSNTQKITAFELWIFQWLSLLFTVVLTGKLFLFCILIWNVRKF